jgi:HAD superfamily hydrolase (TIGR01509 family)
MNLQAVIFDLDGSLIDSMGIWNDVDRDFLRKRGIEPPPDLFDDVVGGNSFVEIAVHFKEKFSLSESIEEIMNEWTEMVDEKYANSVPLKPFAYETLQFLHNHKIKMAIGTSNSLPLTQKALKANNVLHFFDAIVHGNEKTKGKPFPDIFLEAARQLDVTPENCLVIEDVLVGVQAARNANMKVIAIEDHHSYRDKDKIEQLADFYTRDYTEILQLLKLNTINK